MRDPERYRKVKDASSLDRRGLAVLQELYDWREEHARSRDLPRFRIARDAVLIALARQRPRRRGGLAAIPGLPRRWLDPRRAPELLEAISRGSERPESDLPEPRRRPRPRRDRPFEIRWKQIRSRRDAVAARIGIEPQVLASGAVLEEILRTIDGGGEIEGTPGLRSWQARILRECV